MTSEDDQPRPPPTFPEAEQEVTVPAARLAWGQWNHEKNREEGEGDISGSYSGDKIPEGKIRRPFRYEGNLWITVGLSGLHGVNEASAYRLIPEPLFPRPTTTYQTKTKEGDECRADPLGFYDSMVAACGREKYVLSGPPVRFVAEQRPEAQVAELEQMQLTLFPI